MEKDWKVEIYYDNEEVTYEDNKYTELKQIGKGAAANVFKAKKQFKQQKEEFVALRIQRRYYKDDFDQLERFRKYKFINTTYPRNNYAGRAGLFTEYELFDNNITNFPKNELNENIILLLIENIALALEDMHKQGFIHCDVKPDNIVYRKEQDNYKFALCDFSSILELKDMTEPKFIQMTPIFAAPEINLQGKTEGSNEKQDIWSLGVTIYYFCKQDSLFTEDNLEYREEQEFINDSLDQIQNNIIKEIIQICLIVDKQKRGKIEDILKILQKPNQNGKDEPIDSTYNNANSIKQILIQKAIQQEPATSDEQILLQKDIQQEPANADDNSIQILKAKQQSDESNFLFQTSRNVQQPLQAKKYTPQKDLASMMSIDVMLRKAEDRKKIHEYRNCPNQLASYNIKDCFNSL